MRVAELLPPNAQPGECYAKVFVPEEFETVEETVCIREASERLEIIPARYEWVEERVLVKDAYTMLEEVPAEFRWEERRIQTDPGHRGWHVERTASLVSDTNENMAKEAYCLVDHPPQFQTVKVQVQSKPVTTREVVVPAEYQTVRRQKLVAPATTKRIAIPAEYSTVFKTRKVSDSRIEWQRIKCEDDLRTENVNIARDVLVRSGQ
jgi:hypothetical protein